MAFTLLIPAHNEAPVIRDTLNTLTEVFERELGSDWNIIVIDNASTDGTGNTAKEVVHPCIHVLTLAEKGKGHAVREGARRAQTEWVGYTDSDLSVPPADIVEAFRLAKRNNLDAVLGSRFHKKSTSREREWWRTASSHLFHLLAQMIVGVRATDTQCPLKIINTKARNILLETKDATWFFDLEFIKMTEMDSLRIEEISVSWDEHRYPERKSKVHAVKDGVRSIAAMWRIRENIAKRTKAS